jgi:ribosome-associated protein
MSDQPTDVPIRDESIRLGQFLKLANLVDHGAEAKPLVAGGHVRVNGEVEVRRGRQLRVGDVVVLVDEDGTPTGQAVRVATGDVADDLPW